MNNNKIYLILDFDDCVFEHTEALDRQLGHTYVKAAIDYGIDIPDYEAAHKALMDEHYRSGFGHFCFEGDPNYDRYKLFKHIHEFKWTDPECMPKFIEEIKANGSKVERIFRKLPPNVEMVILTHGHRSWTRGNLELLGISDLFPDERIVDAVDADFNPKGRNDKSQNSARAART